MTDKQLQSAAPDYDLKSQSAKTNIPVVFYLQLVLLFGFIAVSVFAGWKFYQRQQNDRIQLKQQQQLTKANQDQVQLLQQQLTQLQQAHTEAANQLAILQDRENNSREDWLVLEAEHLIKLATQQLSFERDVPIAIKALQAADDRLRRSSHPAIVTVRKAIAEDLRALRAIPVVDNVGISIMLSTLTDDIEHLPLNIPEPKSHEQVSTTAAGPRRVDNWSQLPKAIWNDIKALVVIRNHEEPVQALLPPEQRFFLTENLRLQLEQARLAMLSGEVTVFHERIKTAIGWLEHYFNKNAKATSAALQTLQQLQQQNIAPTLPDLSRSYKAVERYLDTQDKSSKTARSTKSGTVTP